MSPLDYIKQGILTEDWEAVCEGYERLTDESLPCPKRNGSTDAGKALKQISDIINDMCATTEKPKKKRGRPKGGGTTKTQKKTTVTKDGEDSSLQLDVKNKTIVQRKTGGIKLITNSPDQEEVQKNIDKMKKHPQDHRIIARTSAQLYDVKCSECEGTFKSSRQQGEMGQKCQKCLKNLMGRVDE